MTISDLDYLEETVSDLDSIEGGKDCIYKNQQSSPGAIIKQDDGNLHVCKVDGSWGNP